MSSDVFNLLCNTLRPYISKEDTRFRNCIPAEIKLAATLYYLSRASDYRMTANLFGLGRSTAFSIVHTVCKPTVRNLLKTYINLPKRDETRRIIQKFECVWFSTGSSCNRLLSYSYKSPKQKPWRLHKQEGVSLDCTSRFIQRHICRLYWEMS